MGKRIAFIYRASRKINDSKVGFEFLSQTCTHVKVIELKKRLLLHLGSTQCSYFSSFFRFA